MTYSFLLQKSIVAKVVGVSLVMLLAACSTDQRYKRQVSGDESYLDTAPLKPMIAPAGVVMSVPNSNYNVQVSTYKGLVGKQLDIRPPVQSLALVSGSRSQSAGDSGTLLLESSEKNQNLWPRVVSLLKEKSIPIASNQEANQTLTTGWVKWTRLDEDIQYEGKYQISLEKQGYQQALVVKTLGLQQQGKTERIVEPAEVQRYNAMMMNTVATGLDNQNNAANSQSAKRAGSLDVQSGVNDVGLPVLIVRDVYAVVWDRLPAALEKLGMKVGDRNRPQGAVAVTYKSLSRSDWSTLGVKDPELKQGDYKLQIGDLNNRTSLQFIDAKGKPLTQTQNDALVSAFQMAFSKVSVK